MITQNGIAPFVAFRYERIILAVEEKLDPVVCLSHTCMRAGICRTQSVWMGMQDEIYKVLEGKTLRYLTDIYKNEVSA